MPDFPEGMSSSDFWSRYKNERMVELAFEVIAFGMYAVGKKVVLLVSAEC